MGKSVDTYIFLGRMCNDEEIKHIKDSIEEDSEMDTLCWDSKKSFIVDGLPVFRRLFMEGLDYEYYVIQQKIGALYDDEADGEIVFDVTTIAKAKDVRFKIFVLQEYNF
jgi:hypothetical protein